jgi:hypothetical protein
MEIGTQEYYKATVLRGFFDDNDREFLVEYFVREFKKAEKENYTANVFYNGCFKSLTEIRAKLANLFQERKRELSWIINDIKLKLKGGDTDNSLNEKLNSVKDELENLSQSNFYTPVQFAEHPRLAMQFNTDTVEYIESSIREAFNQSKVDVEDEVAIDLSDNRGTDKVIMLYKLGVLDFLKEQEPFNLSTNSLAMVLSGITGVDSKTLQSYINPIGNPSVMQKNNPLANEKNVKKVTQTLIEIGFIPSK